MGVELAAQYLHLCIIDRDVCHLNAFFSLYYMVVNLIKECC